MKRTAFTLGCAATACLLLAHCTQVAQWAPRHEIALAPTTLRAGDSEGQVASRLGWPDHIEPLRDRAGTDLGRVWVYRSSWQRRDGALLGCRVYFGHRQQVIGWRITEPPGAQPGDTERLFTEIAP